MYEPKPRDVSGIVLPPELLQLTEQLAEDVHETWSQGRIADGWTYGPVRDDEKRQTPCLVPYDALTEEEKAFDRSTALHTLKLIVAMGYRIDKAE